MLSPGSSGTEQIDVTQPITAAIAHALWQARGGDEMTNWADAEGVVDQLFGANSPGAPAQRPAAAPAPATPRTPGVLDAPPSRRSQPQPARR
jgi:hypothetical protein